MITLIDDSKSQKLYFIYNKIKSTHNNNKKKKSCYPASEQNPKQKT